jgi:outer membrane protein insertion porin family
MLKRVFLLVFSLALLQSNIGSLFAQAPEKKLRLVSLHANGSERYTEAEVLTATGLRLNDQVTQQDLEQAANRLGGTGVFIAVHFQFLPVAQGVDATYQVTDNAATAPVVFENLVWFTPDQLASELHSRFPLFQGRLPNAGTLLEDARLALQGLLNSKNIAGTVKTSINGQLGQFVSVSYSVEGVEPRIAALKFQGARDTNAALLADGAQLLVNSPYAQTTVRAFCDSKLKELYLARGFLKVSFGEPLYKLTNESVQNPTVEVNVPVDEGQQYRFAGVTWTGSTIPTPQQLQKVISLEKGDIANAVRLEKDLEGLRRYYGPYGYLGVSHKLQPQFQQDSTAIFEVQLHEGVPYQMGKLAIHGPNQVLNARLRQAWRLEAGATFDETYPIKFIDALVHAGLPVGRSVWHEDIDDLNKTVDVTLDVRP